MIAWLHNPNGLARQVKVLRVKGGVAFVRMAAGYPPSPVPKAWLVCPPVAAPKAAA